VIRVVSYVNPQAIVVPVNVVQHTETGDYVFVVEDNYAKEVKITKGKTYNDRVEVLQGLKPGDTLIINGYQDLADHVPVQIVQ